MTLACTIVYEDGSFSVQVLLRCRMLVTVNQFLSYCSAWYLLNSHPFLSRKQRQVSEDDNDQRQWLVGSGLPHVAVMYDANLHYGRHIIVSRACHITFLRVSVRVYMYIEVWYSSFYYLLLVIVLMGGCNWLGASLSTICCVRKNNLWFAAVYTVIETAAPHHFFLSVEKQMVLYLWLLLAL